jgi:hypothetical protein
MKGKKDMWTYKEKKKGGDVLIYNRENKNKRKYGNKDKQTEGEREREIDILVPFKSIKRIESS